MGRCDRLLGEWMAARGVRDDIILIGKGAHSPLCYPDVIARQLTESLDRLKTDVIDVYFMHRDNPDVPVGEFVDAMDAEVRAGRIKVYGGSNWTRARMDAAFAYAEKNGKHLPGALSNNFSLAEMVNPVWTRRARRFGRSRGRRGSASGRSRSSPGRARRAGSSPTAPGATSATIMSWSTPGTATRILPDANGRSNWPNGSARARSTWRWPIASTRTSR